jgi:amino acid adenylation domain-containing protein
MTDVPQSTVESSFLTQEPVDHCSSGSTRSFIPFLTSHTEQSIPQRFEQQVTRHPDSIAVKGRKHSLTYDALNRWANRVARAILARLREGEQQTVGLLLDKDAPAIAGLMAVLKAGQIYVPLDPSHPAARASKMLDDAKASIIITDDVNYDAAQVLESHARRLLNIDRLDPNPSDQNLGLSLPPDTLAYIVYTSGSTGEPKGVAQNHRNVLHNISRHTNSLHISSDDRLTWLASISTGQAVTDIYGALLNGATLCAFDVKEGGLFRLADWLKQEEISIYHSSAAVFRHLLDAMDRREEFPSIRVVKLGSEQVFRRDVELWRNRFSPDCIFVNALSSTEAGTLRQILINKETMVRLPVVPVGFPVDDVEVFLLDDAGQTVGSDTPGEIAIRSRYLAPGYWQRPEITGAKFLPDPQGGDARIYLTGDLGRMSPGGCLEYLGRKDLQVKISGFRVEVAEVEAALLDCCRLKQAAVVAIEVRPGVTRLNAYIVRQDDSGPTVESIRAAMQANLPHYMIPSEFIVVDHLPLTAGGKIDRPALASVTPVQSKTERALAVPFSPLESQIAEIWKELFGVDTIGVRHDFFELGGDSVLAVRMMDRIEQSLGTRLPLTSLYSAATVEKLAQVLLDTRRQEFHSPLVAVRREGTRKPIYFLHGDFNGGGFYCLELARHLGEEQPFYTILPHGLDGGPVPGSIQAMAADRLRILLDIQPAGPYVLGGYCNGGLVAFEMARQLWEKGIKVDLLFIIDASAVNARHRWVWNSIAFLASGLRLDHDAFTDRVSRVRRMMNDWQEISREGKRAQAHFLIDKLKKILERLFRPAENCSRVDAPIFRSQDRYERYLTYQRIIRGYIPGFYSERVVLLHTDSIQSRVPDDPTLGWRHVTKNLEVRPIPGDHQTCLTKHVKTLAESLASYLRNLS